MHVLRAIGLCAIVVLLAGVHLLATGFNESARRGMERQNGMWSIPGDSEFVRSTLASPLADDVHAMGHAAQILTKAGRTSDANLLQTYYADCNAQRLLGTDDACTRETVASAIEKGGALAGRDELAAAPPSLETRIADAVTFFLPDEPRLQASTDQNTWRLQRYDGPGVLRYDQPANGAYVFVAARNRSEWTISRVQAVLTLALPNGQSVELTCGPRSPYPFFMRSMEPGGETTVGCARPDGVPLDDLVSAMHALRADAPPTRLVGFEVQDPYAAIVHSGKASTPHFGVAPISNLFLDSPDRQDRPDAYRIDLGHELLTMDCHQLDTCPSAYQTLAMAVEAPFEDHLILLPPVIGVLLGLIIGGLARRALTIGGALAGLLVLVAAIGIALLFQSVSSRGGENGFALMAVGALTVGAGVAFILGLPAFFVTLALMRALRSWLVPAATSADAS